MMDGGTAIRPGGRPTQRGFGKQFTGMPSSKKGPYDGMMDNLDGNDQGPPPPPPTTTPIEPMTSRRASRRAGRRADTTNHAW
jgi:hypothetical protein